MKKMFLGLTVILTMVAAVSVYANTESVECSEYDHMSLTSHVSSQGTHCNGTVGCNCSGFVPITDGEVWQQSYCKRCGHKKGNHK